MTVVHVSGDVYAIASQSLGDDGWLRTVSIASNGQIGDTVINDLEFDESNGEFPWIIEVSPGVYVIAYQGPTDHGWLKTVPIASDGTIGSVIDSFEFDEAGGIAPCIIHVTGNIYAIAYQGPLDDGWVKTVDISTPSEGMRGLGPGAMAAVMGV